MLADATGGSAKIEPDASKMDIQASDRDPDTLKPDIKRKNISQNWLLPSMGRTSATPAYHSGSDAPRVAPLAASVLRLK